MNLQTMRLRVADELGVLSPDGSTIINGVVTSDGIDNCLNDIYREEVFGELSNAYKVDFIQKTYPYPTYTMTNTVAVTTSGTTLVVNVHATKIFYNSMEGRSIHNPTKGESVTITKYTNAQTVTVDTDVSSWVGDTVYVLHNEYTFLGDAADLKEVVRASIKYSANDTDFITCTMQDEDQAYYYGDETFNKLEPICYKTTVNVEGSLKSAIGFLPYPDSYDGKWQVSYISKPQSLGATDEPILDNVGVSKVMIYGAVAWGLRKLRRVEEADRYQALADRALVRLVRTYKPTNRGRSNKLRLSQHIKDMLTRRV